MKTKKTYRAQRTQSSHIQYLENNPSLLFFLWVIIPFLLVKIAWYRSRNFVLTQKDILKNNVNFVGALHPFVFLIAYFSFFSFGMVIGTLPVHAISFSAPKKSFHTRPLSYPISLFESSHAQRVNASVVSEALVETSTPITQPDFCITVPVLTYHHIQPTSVALERNQASLTVDNQIFDSQMAYLSERKYQSITTDQLLHALIAHTPLPEKSVVITFDDGYEDNYTYAYPTLKKYGLIGIFAVPTGLLGTHANTNYYFSWDQLKEMVDSGVITAVNHTQSHYPVGMGDTAKTSLEIQNSQDQLREHFGSQTTTFVYPYGYYQPWVFPLLVRNGILGAFTTREGMIHCQSSILALPRTRVGNTALSNYGL